METEKILKIREITESLLSAMNFDASIAAVEETEGGILVRLDSREAGYLIGRDGDNLKALQQILRALINKRMADAPRLSLDVNNYQQERLAALKSDAKNLARLVAETKTTRTLPPMNAFERRIIHAALADIPEVKTESEGLGEERRIVIKPVNG